MEAANASRQARLAALRTTKASQEQQAGESSSSNAKANANANAAACSSSSSSSTIHPFRRAFLLNSSLRTSSSARLGGLRAPRESADASASAGADADAESAPLTAESSARRVAESSEEMALLRTFRNWDPMTGQPRRAIWTTATPNAAAGIEEEVKGVQAAVLAEDAQRRKQDLDLFNIAPKRANWDLKRHLDKRLKKLERRDREARLILIRNRLKPSKSSSNTTSASSTAAAAAEIALGTTTRGLPGLVDDLSVASDEEEEEEEGED